MSSLLYRNKNDPNWKIIDYFETFNNFFENEYLVTFENYKEFFTFKEEIEEEEDELCSICMEKFKVKAFVTPCGHNFCLKCIKKNLDYDERCPLCKKIIKKFQKCVYK